MSYEKNIRDTTLRIAIASITDTLRVFKDGSRATDYDAGYDDGLDQAIKAVQLFLKVLDEKEKPLDE